MITLNKTKDFITGTVNGEVFGINYNEEIYKKLQDLENKFDSCETPQDALEVVKQFKELLNEDPSAKSKSDIEGLYKGNDGKYYAKAGDIVTNIAVPSILVNKMRDSVDKGISNEPLFKFWFRFLRNKKFRSLYHKGNVQAATDFASRVFDYIDMDYVNYEQVDKLVEEKGYAEEVATELATVKQCKITKEGLLATFKVSKEITKKWILNDKGEKEQVDIYPVNKTIDPITGLVTYGEPDKGFNEDRWFEPAVMGKGGDAFKCSALDKEGHVIKVGSVHSITWDQINTDDYQSCVPGLHVGGLYYIKGYQNSGTETHNVLVDPAHIGAVPDCSSGAIRCVQYYVLDAFSGVNKSIYHSSGYASITDEEFKKMKEELAKEYSAEAKKKVEDLDLLNNI